MPEYIQECMCALIAQHGSFWQLWQPFNNNYKLNRMTTKLIIWKILFHILML